MDNPNILFTAVNLVILVVTLIVSYRRSNFQNVVDDSQAAMNFKKMLGESQSEQKKQSEEIKELKKMLENSHIHIVLDIPIGGKPELSSYIWKQQEESTSR